MRKLYIAEGNDTNYIIVVEGTTDKCDIDYENDKAVIIDWDRDDNEIDEIIDKFNNDPNDTSYWCSTEWVSIEEAFCGLSHEMRIDG